jgi:predicted transcriptional regulator
VKIGAKGMSPNDEIYGEGLVTQPQEGLNLRKWRKRFNVKQSELARRAGIYQSLLSLLEAGKRDFTKETSEKIYRVVKELNVERAGRLAAVALQIEEELMGRYHGHDYI